MSKLSNDQEAICALTGTVEKLRIALKAATERAERAEAMRNEQAGLINELLTMHGAVVGGAKAAEAKEVATLRAKMHEKLLTDLIAAEAREKALLDLLSRAKKFLSEEYDHNGELPAIDEEIDAALAKGTCKP